MTNDEFDEVYYDRYAGSADRAVGVIAGWGYSRYSSDLLSPYRLRGCHALDRETRRTAARCVIFLQSGSDYEWPAFPDNPGLRLLAGLSFSIGLPAGVALLLIGVGGALTCKMDETLALTLVAGGVLVVGSAGYTWVVWPLLWRSEWASFCKMGDFEVWPFLRRAEFDAARRAVR